jgi:hypothetical protein
MLARAWPVLLLATMLAAGVAAAAPAAPAVLAPAQAGMVWRADALRTQPRIDATPVRRLTAGEPVDVLESRPGWLRVRTGRGSGWVRMFSVRSAGAPAGEAGPSAPTRSLARATSATSHALLLGIGEFASSSIPPLPGVGHDVRSARELALAMGVPAAQVTVVRDGELSLAGIVLAVQRLVDRVQAGDRVFVYYSGHGTRYRDVGRPGAPCVTSLLSHDGLPFTDSMLAEALNLLADKADKLLVFVDACFSGGAVPPSRGSGLTPKFFARAGADAACGVPTNVVSRGLEAQGAQRWKARDNFIVVTAARDTEIAFEEAASGGFATRAFSECALRQARDLDGSGAISVGEIGQCAQQRIDAWLAPSRDYLPHHLTVFGNRDFVPMLAAGPPAAGVAEAPAGAPSAPAEVSPPAAAPPATATVRPDRTLHDLYQQRDDRRQVVVRIARDSLKVGRDRLELTVTSSHPGHLYLLYAGSDGTTFDVLFPNRLDQDNHVLARRPLALPRPGWAVEARGPVGTNRLLVLVSDAPRDFSALGTATPGVFQTWPATPQAARGLLQGASAFGAALVAVHEEP